MKRLGIIIIIIVLFLTSCDGVKIKTEKVDLDTMKVASISLTGNNRLKKKYTVFVASRYGSFIFYTNKDFKVGQKLTIIEDYGDR
jgi:hypothetical protein